MVMPNQETGLSFEQFAQLAQGAGVVPVSRELLADGLTPVQAYALIRHEPGSYLLESVLGGEQRARYSFVGFDPDLRVTALGQRYSVTARDGSVQEHELSDPWDGLRATLADYKPHDAVAGLGLPRFWGGAVGYVAYDAVRRFEPTVGEQNPELPDNYDFAFSIGGTLLVFDNVRQTLRIVVPVRIPQGQPLEEVYAGALARIQSAEAALSRPKTLGMRPAPKLGGDLTLPESSFSKDAFCAAVERCREYIRAGDIFQVVLSQRFAVPAKVDLFEVYRHMRALNPSPYMYFLDFPGTRIAGASPEVLVRLVGDQAEVRPIAGTRPRGRNPEEDAALKQEMFDDPKEIAEHVMLVDLGRNDVGRISEPGTVRVTERMTTEFYSHVMHITSNVAGKLQPGRDATDVLRATFPAGTLSGAPKVRAMQIIEELEPVRRGIYGGAVGYIGFDGNMDMAIAIRTIVERGGEMLVQAGAGIVEASQPEAEYQETLNKGRAALLSIAAAQGQNPVDGAE